MKGNIDLRTGFIAYGKPLINRIYWKVENKTCAIIDITDDWKFTVCIIDVSLLDGVLNPFNWSDERFKQLLVGMLPPNRPDTLKRMGMERYDTAEMLYRTRGIDYNRLDWFAWQETDRFEDYHPRYNMEKFKISEIE